MFDSRKKLLNMIKMASSVILFLILGFTLLRPNSALAVDDFQAASAQPLASGICGTVKWSIDGNYRLVLEPNNGVSGKFAFGTFQSTPPWGLYESSIRSVLVKPGVGFEQNDSAAFMFANCNSLANVDISNLDTSNATDLRCMFKYCGSLKAINLSGLDTHNATNMSSMFDGCYELKSANLAGLNTQKVDSMWRMFCNCSCLESVTMSGFDTRNVVSMAYMFYGCSNLKSLDLSNFNTSEVIYFNYMFAGCANLESLNISSFSTLKAQETEQMFANCDKLQTLRTGPNWKQTQITWSNLVSYLPTKMSDGSTMFNKGDLVPDGQRTFTHVHEWSDWGTSDSPYDRAKYKAPTCTETGSRSRYCVYCGAEEWQTIPAKGHNWTYDEKNKDNRSATFLEDGCEIYKCANCGSLNSIVLPKKEMTPTDRQAVKVIEGFYRYAKTYNVKKMNSCFKKKPKKAFFEKGYLRSLLKKQNKKRMRVFVLDGYSGSSAAKYTVRVEYRTAYRSFYRYFLYGDSKNMKAYVKSSSFSSTDFTFNISLVKVKGKWKIRSATSDLKDSVNGEYNYALKKARSG